MNKKRLGIRPQALELEELRRSTNRKLWAVLIFCGLLSMTSLGLLFLALIKPTPVIAFDAKGRALVFEETVKARASVSDIRIEYFAQEFLDRMVGVDSEAIEEDLASGLNMMTPRLRKVVLTEGKELQRKRNFAGLNLLAELKELHTKIGPYDAEKSPRFNVVTYGRIDFGARRGALTSEAPREFFHAELVFERVPVSLLAIHGLQVEWFHVRWFDSEEALKVFVSKRKRV